MGAMVLYGTLLVVAYPSLPARLRPVACATTALLVTAVATSRVLLGVHFPTDVVAGMLAGAAWGALCVIAFRGWHRQ
jgi:undecaprenyl-diphosphatase